jgi:hypothetical protein
MVVGVDADDDDAARPVLAVKRQTHDVPLRVVVDQVLLVLVLVVHPEEEVDDDDDDEAADADDRKRHDHNDRDPFR